MILSMMDVLHQHGHHLYLGAGGFILWMVLIFYLALILVSTWRR